MSDDENQARSKAMAFAVILLLLVPVYLLAPGPIDAMINRGYLSHETGKALGDTIYAPLKYLYENSESVRKLYDTYFSLFR